MDFIIFAINFLFTFFYVVLVCRALLPWLPLKPGNLVTKAITVLTDPVLKVIRAGLPPLRMGMDVSPFIVLILFWLLQQVILKLIS